MLTGQWMNVARLRTASKGAAPLATCLYCKQPRTPPVVVPRQLESLRYICKIHLSDPRHHNMVLRACRVAQPNLAAERHKARFMSSNPVAALADHASGLQQVTLSSYKASSAKLLARTSAHCSRQHSQQQTSLFNDWRQQQSPDSELKWRQQYLGGCTGQLPSLQGGRRCSRGVLQAQPALGVSSGSKTAQYHSSSAAADSWSMSQELQEHWEVKMRDVKRSEAVQAKAQLDMQWQLGIHPNSLKGIQSGQQFRKAREQHPRSIALLQFQDEYKAIGMDAVLLMEHADLPAPASEIPTVRVTEDSLQQVLQQAVAAGLEVALWNTGLETLDNDKPKIGVGQTARYLTQLVSPETPYLLHGYSESLEDRDFDLPNIPGVSISSTGRCTMFVFDQRRCVVSVYEGLSDHGIWGIITKECGRVPSVYLHRPLELARKLRPAAEGSDLQQRYNSLRKRLIASIKKVVVYDSKNGLEGFRNKMKEVTAISQDSEIGHKPAWDASTGSWPGVRPLYHSTITQLGLIKQPVIPGLVQCLLPEKGAHHLAHEVLTELLIAPPSHAVADSLRQVLRIMGSIRELDRFDMVYGLRPSKVTVVLNGQEGHERFFWSLENALSTVLPALDPARYSQGSKSIWPALQDIVHNIWPLLCLKMNCDELQLTQQQVLQAAEQALHSIRRVVVDPDAAPSVSSSEDNDSQDSVRPLDARGQLGQFADNVQRYAQRVNEDAIKAEAQQVCAAFDDLLATAESLVSALQRQVLSIGARLRLSSADRPTLYVDEDSFVVWIKMPSSIGDKLQVVDLGNLGQQKMVKPQGADVRSRNMYTCEALDDKVAAYADAVDKANEAAVEALKGLSIQLKSIHFELSAAVQLGILLATLLQHSRAARTAGWSLPAVGRSEQLQAGVSEAAVGDSGAFSLKGVYPYWMSSQEHSGTVKNNVDLPGLMLLTGPNMSGKSTLLRAVAAAALCANVGLHIPASPGSLVPHLDAVMLRTFSGDAPVEELSAYGVEMVEMKYVLADAWSNSLVLVDELGKGTEVEGGTAMTASIIRKLAQINTYGIFATHLHGVPVLLADEPGVAQCCVEVVEHQLDDGSSCLLTTRRVVPGICTRSLAYQVAREQGVPEEVLQRAYHYQTQLSHLSASIESDSSMDTDNDSEELEESDDLSKLLSILQQTGRQQAAGTQQTSLDPRYVQKLQQQEEIVRLMLARLQMELPPASNSIGSSPLDPMPQDSLIDVSAVRHLTQRLQPPPMDSPEPVLYVVRYRTGDWYVGQTKHVEKRWARHKGRDKKLAGVHVHQGKSWLNGPEMWYVVLKKWDDLRRREVEGKLMEAMDAAGFRLFSLHGANSARRAQ